MSLVSLRRGAREFTTLFTTTASQGKAPQNG